MHVFEEEIMQKALSKIANVANIFKKLKTEDLKRSLLNENHCYS